MKGEIIDLEENLQWDTASQGTLHVRLHRVVAQATHRHL